MSNSARPRLTKIWHKLRLMTSFAPSPKGLGESWVRRGSLDSARQREVQLELDLTDHRRQPWSFTD